MPITSHQVGGMIGGQQAMFGNFASYSQQISPGAGGGMAPTYQNPMGGGGGYAQNPLADPMMNDIGVRGVSAAGNIAMPAMGMAAMAGSFLPGRMGSAFGMLNPTTAAMTGFGGATGLNFGGHGILSGAGWRNMASGMGRIASGGIGGIARAGFAGLGGAALAAAPAMIAGQALQYGVGQMVQGAQFQNQVGGFLQNQFRHLNPQSETGFGFSRQQTSSIASMIRTMGHQDTMTGPQELVRVMKQGVGMGHFKAVQDAKEFKTKFKDMVKALKSISEDMNTTLEGAMPFFQNAKRMGFWTPKDIAGSTQMTRQAAQATGMSIAQTQGMMAQGAHMARQVGAVGSTGAQGMAASMGMIGGGLRTGAISERDLSEATGGLTGTAAIQSYAGQTQASATRFAQGRTGRWLLAALGNKGFQGFDAGRLQQLVSGNMSIGDISRLARKNISRYGAFNFVQNEQDLRGQLLKQGPGAQAGFVRGLVGKQLFGTSARDKYTTRRVIQRFFGGSARDADIRAKLARSAPEIMDDNSRRSAAVLDQQERNREELMNNSYEGLKRKAAGWWDKNVKEPLQKFGAQMDAKISNWWERTTDQLWGRASKTFRPRGISQDGAAAMRDFAMGDTQKMQDVFGKRGDLSKLLGGSASTERGPRMTVAGASGWGGGVLGSIANTLSPGGGNVFGDVTQKELGMAQIGVNLIGKTGRARREAERKGYAILRATQGGISAVSNEAAKALGMGDSGKDARMTMRAAQAEMGKASYIRAMQKFQEDNQNQRSWWDKLTGKGADDSNIGSAMKMVEAIRSSKVGGAALRKLVGTSGDLREAAMRVAAAQSREQLDSTIGISTKHVSDALGIQGGTAKEQMKKIQEAVGKAAGGIAVFTGKATGVKERQQAIMGLFKGPGASQFRRAMTLMAKTTSSGEPDPKAREEARNILQRMSTDKKNLSPEQRDVLKKMADPNDPNAKNIAGMASLIGKATQAGERVASKEVIERRMSRLKASMGKEQDTILEEMDKNVKNVGGEGQGLGSYIREMMDEKGGAQDPEKFQNRLTELAQKAASAKTPEEREGIMKAVQSLKDKPGGEAFATALQRGVGSRMAIDKLTGSGRFKQVGAARDLAAQIGFKFDRGTMDAIRKNDRTALNKATAGLSNAAKKRAEELFSGIQKGGPEGMDLLMKAGVSSASARAGMQLHDKDNTLRNQMKNLKAGEHIGEMGSAKGRHMELNRINTTLTEVLKAIKQNGGTTGNLKEEAKD